MNDTVTLPPGLNRLGRIAPILGVVALLLFGIIAWGAGGEGHPTFWQAYLYAFLVWTGFSLGCLGLMLLHYVVRGSWGKPVIRLFEAGARCLPLNFVMFLPLLLGAPTLFPWANEEILKHDEILEHRHIYMNLPSFGIRGVIFFAIWIGFTFFLTRYSRLQDKTHDPALSQLRTNVSSIGMVIFAITVNFAYTDWAMSLEKHWYSTIYGVWFMVANSIGAMTLVTAITALNKKAVPYDEAVTNDVRKDLGNLMLVHIMLWTYFALSQFLIIWSANKPDEVTFYLSRFDNGWLPIGWFIVLFQFFAPFLALLSGKTKKYATGVASVAIWLLILRPIDIAWIIMPSFAKLTPLAAFVPCLLSCVAFGGLWFGWFTAQLRQAPLIPSHEIPATQEALHHA